MIRYALVCDEAHGFEAWFSTSGDYDMQVERGLVECPQCGSTTVKKQIMAPSVRTARKAEARKEIAANGAASLHELARKMQAHIRSNYDYVGRDFAKEARAIHEGKKPERLIYGETTPEEREKLAEDDVPVAPLPEPFAPTPPKKAN
jgi:hypothetical protein